MKRWIVLCVATALVFGGCSVIRKLTESSEPREVEGFGTSRASDLTVTPAETQAMVEWGLPYEIPLEVTWKEGQKLAVQLALAEGTPDWLKAEIVPAIVEPPGRAALRLNPLAADGKLGETTVTIEASAYGMRQPVAQTVTVTLVRQAGNFERLETAPVTRECRNVCGKVERGGVTFYDILREKDQECSDDLALPVSQVIGVQGFMLSERGFGFGRTCRVAGFYSPGGNLSFFNLGLTSRLPRGALLLDLRGIRDAWLSADNTVCVVQVSDQLAVYDVATAIMLAPPCRSSRAPENLSLSGKVLSSDVCQWELK